MHEKSRKRFTATLVSIDGEGSSKLAFIIVATIEASTLSPCATVWLFGSMVNDCLSSNDAGVVSVETGYSTLPPVETGRKSWTLLYSPCTETFWSFKSTTVNSVEI